MTSLGILLPLPFLMAASTSEFQAEEAGEGRQGAVAKKAA